MPASLLQPVELTIELATVATVALSSSPRRSPGGWRARAPGGRRRSRRSSRCRSCCRRPCSASICWSRSARTGPGGAIARLWGAPTLAFTFGGLVVGSVVYSLPFVVQPIRNAFAAIGDRPLEVAATLRASPARAFFAVALPLASPGLLTGAVLGFAHTVGEFGVVLMIGGAIPGRTAVVSTTIFDYVETGEWGAANALAAGMVVFAFVVILAMIAIEKRFARGRP